VRTCWWAPCPAAVVVARSASCASARGQQGVTRRGSAVAGRLLSRLCPCDDGLGILLWGLPCCPGQAGTMTAQPMPVSSTKVGCGTLAHVPGHTHLPRIGSSLSHGTTRPHDVSAHLCHSSSSAHSGPPAPMAISVTSPTAPHHVMAHPPPMASVHIFPQLLISHGPPAPMAVVHIFPQLLISHRPPAPMASCTSSHSSSIGCPVAHLPPWPSCTHLPTAPGSSHGPPAPITSCTSSHSS